MKKFTVNDIRSLDPCTDPLEFEGVEEDSEMTLLQMLELNINSSYKVWTAVNLAPRAILRQFTKFVRAQAESVPVSSKNARVRKNLALDCCTQRDKLSEYRRNLYAASDAAADVVVEQTKSRVAFKITYAWHINLTTAIHEQECGKQVAELQRLLRIHYRVGVHENALVERSGA